MLKHKILEVNIFPPGSKIAHINLLIYTCKIGCMLCAEKLKIQQGKMRIKILIAILEFELNLNGLGTAPWKFQTGKKSKRRACR